MGHNIRIPEGFRPADLDDAQKLRQPVTIYCLNCATPRRRDPERLRKLKGNLVFGMLYGGFWCTGCRASAVVAIFPFDIATPREWARDQADRFSEARILG